MAGLKKNLNIKCSELFLKQVKEIGDAYFKSKSWAIRKIINFYISNEEQFQSALKYYLNVHHENIRILKLKPIGIKTFKFDVHDVDILKQKITNYSNLSGKIFSFPNFIVSIVDQYFNEQFNENPELFAKISELFSLFRIKPHSYFTSNKDIFIVFSKDDILDILKK